jgi:16S rRNA (cytidine1402-2'-O)-methyltransferase
MTALYIVATPIGNLRDITLRAIDTLREADVIFCEDTRHTAKLLSAHGIKTRCMAYHEHNGEQARPLILDKLSQGQRIALVSDAGTPLISDPGYKLVKEVREAGFKVVPIPGVSAAITALCAAGLPTDQFHFCGFLPAKSAARREKLSALHATAGTLVFYESHRRVADFLTDAAHVFGGNREATIARELTKTYEEFKSGTLASLAQYYHALETLKGEVVILIAPADAESQHQAQDISSLLQQALEKYSVKEAAEMVAKATGTPKRDIYQLALSLVKKD